MSNAATFDFGSVGDTLPTLREHEKAAFERTTVKYSPKTPLKLSTDKTELFVMNKSLADSVADNLKNLIMTNRGERVMQPRFGANLKSILGEFGTEGFEGEVMVRIKSSVKKYLPFVSLGQFSIEKLDSPPQEGTVVVKINITYSIPTASINGQQLSVVMSTIA
tara:strand:+ start:313 stop:804 length:492 start_codon:yes stop_codon:yes gene_type:complete